MRQVEAHEIGDFFAAPIADHFAPRLEQALHLHPPVGQHEGACGRHVEHPLVHGALHLLAGAVEIDLRDRIEEGQTLVVIDFRMQPPRLSGILEGDAPAGIACDHRIEGEDFFHAPLPVLAGGFLR